MKKFWQLGIILGLISFLFIAGCQSGNDEAASQEEGTDSQEEAEGNHEEEEHDHDHGDEAVSFDDVPENIQIEGLSDHYHTGDVFKLEAVTEEDLDHWHWYIRDSSEEEWTVVEDQFEDSYIGDAEVDGQEVIAVLYSDDHEAVAKSPVTEITIDDHEHGHHHHHGDDEESQQIYEGYFEDEQVEDRPLADWEGDWQSIYPYLEDGSLDEVFEHKAEESDDMTADEYKDYYTTGYETDIERIVIDGDEITFYQNGEEHTGTYAYDSYEILEYEAGNRGVRYIFELEGEADENLPGYIQFSDHGIAPSESWHFHLYMGDDNDALLEEMDNWPTYYPSDLDTDEIVHELIAH